MSVMPRDHEWTVADLALTPDDGLRYELVDGVLLVSPAPTNRHQIVLGELYALLRAARTADVRVLVAPTTIGRFGSTSETAPSTASTSGR